ncbi:MAG: hypothetical protein KC493_14830 [Bacteriovoracaceae bacterium]|nr:hypothetical protein [Bacteriovoracaceae bacterium]
MKIILFATLLSCLTSMNAYSSSETWPVNFNIRPEAQLYDHLMKGLWKDVPAKSILPEIPIDDEGDLTAKIQGGHIQLGNQGDKYFSIRPLGDNKVELSWNLEKVQTLISVRADWVVEILGVRIRKHEVFNVDASGIRNAKSIFAINFENGEFSFTPISNTGFKFNRIKITSEDDDLVTWFLSNFNSQIKGILNREVSNFVNSDKFINTLKVKANENLQKLENINLKLSEFAADMNIWFTQFDLDKDRVAVSVDSRFNSTDSNVHICASEMKAAMDQKNLIEINNKDNNNPGSILVPHRFIEKIIENLATLEIDENEDGHPDEPLFCFGYKDPEHSGELEEFSFKILGKERNLKLKFWAIPVGKPLYKYERLKTLNSEGKEVSDHLITLKMSAQVKIENLPGYPRVVIKKNQIDTSFTARLKLAITPGKGLQLIPQSISLDKFKGKLYYKIKKYIPKIRVPFFSVRKKLEKALLEEMKVSLSEEILIDEVLPALEMKVKLKGYELLKESHKMNFSIGF